MIGTNLHYFDKLFSLRAPQRATRVKVLTPPVMSAASRRRQWEGQLRWLALPFKPFSAPRCQTGCADVLRVPFWGAGCPCDGCAPACKNTADSGGPPRSRTQTHARTLWSKQTQTARRKLDDRSLPVLTGQVLMGWSQILNIWPFPGCLPDQRLPIKELPYAPWVYLKQRTKINTPSWKKKKSSRIQNEKVPGRVIKVRTSWCFISFQPGSKRHTSALFEASVPSICSAGSGFLLTLLSLNHV